MSLFRAPFFQALPDFDTESIAGVTPGYYFGLIEGNTFRGRHGDDEFTVPLQGVSVLGDMCAVMKIDAPDSLQVSLIPEGHITGSGPVVDPNAPAS